MCISRLYVHASRHLFLNTGSTSAYVKLHVSELLLQQATAKAFASRPRLPSGQTTACLAVDCADGRSKRLSNLGGPNSSRVLGPQGVTVADFPTGQELDAANGVVHEDAAIGINRKLVVDSLKASIPPEILQYLACINAIHAYYPSASVARCRHQEHCCCLTRLMSMASSQAH